ncbi:Ammonia monooxygenase [Sphingobium yanoikuyae]|uniref:Ammonia monooxygenase n=1 Tax=Sphingobium yanoikuyae TaxID=13690 RepID=A0A084E6D0_SPHYA|nr:DUF6527 family protein [Sphingobium yanoikuyae]KEZ13522.1 Ammonia monooxygenase [Sphingobium yanoikuyae]
MGALSAILRGADDGGLLFFCPGCRAVHGIKVGDGPGPRWGYNGNPTASTFTPSVLVTTGRAVDPNFQPEPGDPPEVCHSFVTDGNIQFLSDSTHALAGQTVVLPPFKWGDD